MSITIQVAIPSAEESLTTHMFKHFKEDVEKACPELNIQIYCKGTLFKQGAELGAMKEGNLGMATFSAQDLSNLLPKYAPLTRGYLFKDFPQIESFYKSSVGKGIYKEISAELHTKVLGVIYIGNRVIGINRETPITNPEDLDSLRMRMPKGDAWKNLAESLWGGIVTIVQTAIGEVVAAFKENTIDGQDNPVPTIQSTGFAPYTKQIVLTNHLVDCLFVGISKSTWTSLNKHQKEAIKTAMLAAKNFQDKKRMNEEITLLSKFANEGILITTPDAKAFREKAGRAYALTGPQIPEEWLPFLN